MDIIVRAAGDAPVRIQATPVDRDEGARCPEHPLVVAAKRRGLFDQLGQESSPLQPPGRGRRQSMTPKGNPGKKTE